MLLEWFTAPASHAAAMIMILVEAMIQADPAVRAVEADARAKKLSLSIFSNSGIKFSIMEQFINMIGACMYCLVQS